jgi:hypothetical protein
MDGVRLSSFATFPSAGSDVETWLIADITSFGKELSEAAVGRDAPSLARRRSDRKPAVVGHRRKMTPKW